MRVEMISKLFMASKSIMKKQIFMINNQIFAYKFKLNNEAKSINQSVKMKSEFLRIENIFEANSILCHRIHFFSRENFLDSFSPHFRKSLFFLCKPSWRSSINYFP